jgi:trigger factor
MGLFTSAPDKVKFKKVKEDACLVTFSVEIPSTEVESETQNAIVRLQQRARLPGFRPGKAPLELVKKNFTGHAREQVLDHLLRKHVPEGLKELNIRPVATPAVEDVQWAEGKPLKVTVQVEIPPVVAPKDYTKIKVAKKSSAVTDEQLAARIEELREANARLEKASEEAVAKNHYVVIDYQAYENGQPVKNGKGENELVDMSSDQTLEGLADGLAGMKRGDSKDVSVKLGGKPAVLKATVKEIKTKILPAVDAEFAKDIGFETVEDLKSKLKGVMEDETKHKTEREVTQQIEEALLKANKIPVPPSLVEAQAQHMLERFARQLGGQGWNEQQMEDLKKKILPSAEDQVRISYLLPAIAEKEKIEALEADLQAELDKNLNAIESDAKKEEIRKLFNDRKDSIAGMIRDRKTMEFLRAKAQITEA